MPEYDKLKRVKDDLEVPDGWKWNVYENEWIALIHEDGDKHIDLKEAGGTRVIVEFRVGEEDTQSITRVKTRYPSEIKYEIKKFARDVRDGILP